MEKPSINLGFLFLAGAGFGLAYGFVRSAQLSTLGAVTAFVVILLIQWLIFRSGKAASYANAQAWASAQAAAAAEASARAEALSMARAEAFSTATATAIASAQATNSVILQLAALPTPELVYDRVRSLVQNTDEELENILKGDFLEYNKNLKSVSGNKPLFLG